MDRRAPSGGAPLTQARDRRVRAVVSVIVTVGLLALVASRVGLRPLAQALRQADPGALVLLVAWNALLHVLVPAEKWRRILAHLGHPLALRDALGIWLGCQPLRFALPLKSGEIFKVVYLERVHGVPAAVGAWAVLFDKLGNVVALVSFATLGLSWASLGAEVNVAVVALLACGPLLLVRGVPTVLARGSERLPGRLGRFARELIQVVSLLPTRVRLGFLGVSALQATAEGLSFALCLHALGAKAPLAEVLVRTPLVILLANLPVTVSGIGTREVGMLLLFSDYGRAETLAAAGLLLSFVGPVLLVLLGAPFVSGFSARIFARDRRANADTADVMADSAPNA